MVYGSEAVLPTDLEYGSPRLKAYDKQKNKETQENVVDQLKEARDMASSTQQGTSRSFDATMTRTCARET